MDKYLQQVGFRKGSADNNLYIKVSQGNILLIEVYVDDIIFGSNDDRLIQKFAKDMKNEFEMSLLGELSFFPCFQISMVSSFEISPDHESRFRFETSMTKMTPTVDYPAINLDNNIPFH